MAFDVDLTKDARDMTDDELETLLRLAELMKDAEKEHQRRLDEADPNVSFPHYKPIRSTTRTTASCPNCGHNDTVLTSKTLYGTPLLGQGGEPIGAAALCKCGQWYETKTGEVVNPKKMYTY